MDVITDAIAILIVVLAWKLLGKDWIKENRDYIERKIEERRNNTGEP